jgi:predicted NBD/HSP70 family sugar kinase
VTAASAVGDRGETRKSLRRRNLSTLLRQVHRSGGGSRSALTAATGLNRSTVGALLADLQAYGLVEEDQPEATGLAGRPSPVIRPTTAHVVVGAIDIRPKSITLGVGGLGRTLLHRWHHAVDNDGRTYADTLSHLGRLLDGVRAAMEPSQHLVAVGVAAPGVVRTRDGFVHVAPNLSWHDQPLGADLGRLLGPDVDLVVANEANLGAIAEHRWGAGVGVDDVLYVSSEIGLGGGVILGGRLHVGAGGYGGEIGHTPVNTGPDAMRCRCASVGCLEAEAGELALLRLLGRPPSGDLAGQVARILAEAQLGDPQACEALAEVGRRLGRGLAGAANLLNPRRIVLGGFLGEAFDLLRQGVEEEMRAHTLEPTAGDVTLVRAKLGETSTLVGAIEVALEPLLRDPARSPVRLP